MNACQFLCVCVCVFVCVKAEILHQKSYWLGSDALRSIPDIRLRDICVRVYTLNISEVHPTTYKMDTATSFARAKP